MRRAFGKVCVGSAVLSGLLSLYAFYWWIDPNDRGDYDVVGEIYGVLFLVVAALFALAAWLLLRKAKAGRPTVP